MSKELPFIGQEIPALSVEGGEALLPAFFRRLTAIGHGGDIERNRRPGVLEPSDLNGQDPGDNPLLSFHLVDLIRLLSERAQSLQREKRDLLARLEAAQSLKEEAIALGHRLADQRDQVAELFELALEERDEAIQDTLIAQGERRRAIKQMLEARDRGDQILAENAAALQHAREEAHILRLILDQIGLQIADLSRSAWSLPMRKRLNAIGRAIP
ncbi:MAG: hypothetical protein JW797_10300 [Bradymonadales bacterium]|nr:hypothetical protein [Bradymonadales bacterium]